MVAVRALCLIVLMSFAKYCNSKENTLELVLGIFRHGDRTNDQVTVYPKDPYKNSSYYPYGYGQLTNAGKRRLYSLGKKLRKQYKNFLDSIYTPDLLYATTTNIPRTKSSLLLLLAGLFPPVSTGLEWNDELNWTPIPFVTDNQISATPPLVFCREYQDLHKKYLNSYEINTKIKTYEKWFPYVSHHTGLKNLSIMQLILLYYHLQIQSELGMPIPAWSYPLHPHFLKNMTIDYLNTLSATNELRQLYGGKFIKKMISIMNQKINGTLSPSNRKLFLYSGHDANVLAYLSALNANFYHLPPYGACIILELHKKNEQYFVRILYEDYTSHKFKQLNIRGCANDCPFDQFLELIKDNLPVDDSKCDDRNVTKNPLIEV